MSDTLLFSLDGRTKLANSILKQTNIWSPNNKIVMGSLNTQKFSDGELCVDFGDSVRGKSVYILSSPNTSDEIMKLNLAIDAAKRGAAKEIIPILPYFPYARQDKKDQSRGPIGAKVMAEMIEQRGATSIITYDLHADQIQGFFNIPVTHLEGKNVFDEYISLVTTQDTILCGPDAGSGKRVKRMKDQLLKRYGMSLNYVMMDKTRKAANTIDEMVIIGDVTGKDVIILDDMIDTAGTLCKAADVLIKNGAKSVRAIISHGVLSGPALERIGGSKLTELIISDSLEAPDYMGKCTEHKFDETICIHIRKGWEKIKVLSVDKQIGFAMAAINNKLSYEALREGGKNSKTIA
jgi:ribose-phosphate pyrophosphokinase